jgi:NTE family protein
MPIQNKVGLVLSGGGAKGAYQAGVIRCMAEMNMPIDAVAGASIGALNGAVVASAGSVDEASVHLSRLWQTLADESPLKVDKLAVAGYLGYLCLLGTTRLSPLLKLAKGYLAHQKIFDLGVLDDSPVRKLVDEYTSPEKLRNGLPLYVSVFESEEIMVTVAQAGLGILGLRDTKPSEFFHVQAFPAGQQRDVILASASLPILFSSQGINGKRYVDGGIGGWQKAQGNTPITPLLTEANCSHVVVTHLSDGSLWNRHDFPDVTLLEVRPKNPITQESMFQDLLNFKADKINRWIDQGYEDAHRCFADAARVLKYQTDARAAQLSRDVAIAKLNDGFQID